MRLAQRFTRVLLALLLPLALLVHWNSTQGVEPFGLTAPTVPGRVGHWEVVAEERLDAEVLRVISPDGYLLRRYEGPGGAPIWLYVGIYAGAGNSRSAHDPETCYPAQGWEIVESEVVSVQLPGGSERLEARLLRAHKEALHEEVLYWFQAAHRWPRRPAIEQLLRIRDAAYGQPQYAFVRLSAATAPGMTLEPGLIAFAGHVAPAIRRSVEQVRSESPRGPTSSAELSRLVAQHQPGTSR